jgi:hypothetical protein
MATNDLFTTDTPQTIGGPGGLAKIYKPANGSSKYVNITEDYPWTLSVNAKKTTPRVILKEFQLNETTIRRQYLFYTTAAGNFSSSGNTPPVPTESIGQFLQPYEELYPKNKTTETGFVYDIPYFSDINFEVKSSQWATLDGLEQAQKAVVGTAGFAAGAGFAGVIDQLVSLGAAAAGAGASLLYPKVGIMDRPRIWQNHEFRTIEIKFPLFNTIAPDDWKRNRLLCELLVNQNLYNKRDFITSVPPVFYEVLVIGQHYSFASCATNVTVYNRGNVRVLKTDDNKPVNVPDVYEINLSLTDMVMPSKNQFQSINDPVVTANIIRSNFSNTPTDTGFSQVQEQFGLNVISGLLQGGAAAVNNTGATLNNASAFAEQELGLTPQ